MRRVLRSAGAVSVLAAAVALSGAAGAAPPRPSHAAITITSDADFQSCACVTKGSGTATDPFVIGPWKISAPSRGGSAIKIDNSKGSITKFFRIDGITVGYDDLNPTHAVIWLVKVTQATTVADVQGTFDGIGVRLDSDSNITLTGLEFNRMQGDGAQLNSSTNVSIVNSKLKSEQSGFHAESSSNLQIGVGCKTSCNDFTYDNFRGLWLRNTHDATVRYLTTAAEDTTAMYLDGTGTYNVDIGFSTANASGSICPVPEGPTGLVTDTDGGIRLVNGAHHNFIHDVTAHGNVAQDIASGGDGFWPNPCTGELVKISPATAPMGPGNVFVNVCYSITNIPDLPPSRCR